MDLLGIISAVFVGGIIVGVVIEHYFFRRPPVVAAPKLLFTFTSNFIKFKSKNMAVTLSTIEEVTGQVTPTDKKGNPAKVEEGSVSYSSSDESIAVVEEDPTDETKFKIVAKGAGVAQVDVSADADLGEGVVTITGFVAVEVLPAGATGFGITLGTPTEQP